MERSFDKELSCLDQVVYQYICITTFFPVRTREPPIRNGCETWKCRNGSHHFIAIMFTEYDTKLDLKIFKRRSLRMLPVEFAD